MSQGRVPPSRTARGRRTARGKRYMELAVKAGTELGKRVASESG